jgi:uncharacterized membrane protein
MFDSETLRPVIIATALYLVFSVMVPRIVKKPTGIKVIDDLIMYLVAQKGFLMSGTILVGVVVYLANYINLKMMVDSDM